MRRGSPTCFEMAMMMAMSTPPLPYSIAQARDQLTALVRRVERGARVGLTRRGKLVAVVVSEADFRQLSGEAAGLRRALASFLEDKARMGVLTNRQIKALRDRTPGRAVTL
jgi:prevent-host-death family protein